MNPITRRKFLAAAACTVAATRLSAQSHEEAHVSLALPAEADAAVDGGPVPAKGGSPFAAHLVRMAGFGLLIQAV